MSNAVKQYSMTKVDVPPPEGLQACYELNHARQALLNPNAPKAVFRNFLPPPKATIKLTSFKASHARSFVMAYKRTAPFVCGQE